MEEAVDLIPIIERWQAADDGIDVPARSVEEAAAILPYTTLQATEPLSGRC